MKGLTKMLTSSALALVAVAAALYAALQVMEPRLVFPAPVIPEETLHAAEATMGARSVRLITRDGVTLYGWRLGEGPRLVVIFTGNAASVSQKPERYQRFLDLGFSVLHVNYRGYPGSTGTPTEAGLGLDAEAIWAEALTSHDPRSIAVYAKSLGGGVAMKLVGGLHHQAQPAALVLDSTFTALVDVAAETYPWLPVRRMLTTRFDSLSLAPAIACPTLVLHGREDTKISVEHGHKLRQQIRGAKIHTAPGLGHDDDLLQDEDSWRSVVDLLEANVRAGSGPGPREPGSPKGGEELVRGPGGG